MPKALRQILRRLLSAQPRSRKQFRAIKIDALESRIMPTAVVNFTGTAMTITGDTSSNNISLTKVGNQVHVDANGGLITVAGSDVPSFDFNLTGAFSLTATFQDNTDALVVAGPLQLKSVSVNLGGGPTNSFAIIDGSLTGKLTVTGGDGVDVVQVVTTTVAGATVINTGWNSDIVQIVDSSFTGTTSIKTDLGIDQVVIAGGATSRAKFVGTLSISTGDDIDVVVLAKTETKPLIIDSGDGADIVQIVDQLNSGGLTVKTGSGTDTVVASGILQSGTAANLIDAGSDTDVVQLQSSTLTGATTLNLGSGQTNTLAIDDVSFNNTFTLNSQGTLDQVLIEQNTALTGVSTFAKAAKFNLGLQTIGAISTANVATKTKFLSTVAFSGRGLPSVFTVNALNTSFAVTPTLKNVLLV